MAKEKRFEIIDTQGNGFVDQFREMVDNDTGAHYLIWNSGYAGSITPLLGPDGKPVVTAHGSAYRE